ncbi:NADPH-dependent 7-cyano-7-deazaguanine reductase QueF [Alteromonas lipolytica]|uniref:NADPH-dependent 7-cyano-7-deazaguanine reductase n=1 Tax=Alteromonas lipolytica TaxID=1856405 RepID=A0A1E8FEV0_9ALTE|nr:NADPH-dependent 7-cyano-7-deazaguanine reductase QueF [Alteromonas lipolytica]OFI34118.1 NADPH-dependent 7-cyano-7-deazaguanine reductase QueF [Alteromonas lipolytica]GGF65247.1 NADPH-dependent 7-cyano-7-deazaguanine reductase [Alteromonas lipolytica]
MTTKQTATPSLPANLTLGQKVDYIEQYSPSLLQGVPRTLSRDQIGVSHPLPFDGIDIWNGYELSWLNPKGKPQVAILQCRVPINSANLIESKSFKLYLNSFNQSVFSGKDEITEVITRDLSACAEAPVEVQLFPASAFSQLNLGELSGTVIDDLDIEIHDYQPNPQLLKTTGGAATSETLVSHLLKSNCLITSQPDWASVQIHYEGEPIDHAGLLAYLISFRRHNEFHEQCIERIFCDVMAQCHPVKLAVYARYTRRGGLDINPMRSNCDFSVTNDRLARQ